MTRLLLASLILAASITPSLAWWIEDRTAQGNGDFMVEVAFPDGDVVNYFAGCAQRDIINTNTGERTQIRKAGPVNDKQRVRYNIWYQACRGISDAY